MKNYANFADTAYQGLLRRLLLEGNIKDNRTGVKALSIFGANYTVNLNDGFPLLTTKKMAWRQVKSELMWFLKGSNNIKELWKDNNHIWDDDAYRKYCRVNDNDLDTPLPKKEFIEKVKNDEKYFHYGLLGPIYGTQWRSWGSKTYIDQISDLIANLKDDPYSRRHIVSAWNVEDLGKMTLPPCHYSFQCDIDDGHINLLWNQRSADAFLGLPFNIASYALLTHMLAKELNLKPGKLIGNIGNLHLYVNHVEQAKEQIKRKPFALPEIKINSQNILKGEIDVELLNYESHQTLTAKLNT